MGKITFSNGVTATFEGNPTQQDIEEMAQAALKQKPTPLKTDSKGLSMEGGANSPALKKAQELQRVAQRQAAPFSIINPAPDWVAKGLANTGGLKTLQYPVSVPASIASDFQQGKPQNIIPDLGKVVTGQSAPDYKQILRQANVPPVAANVGGEAMDILLYPGGARGAVDLAKATPVLVKATPVLVKAAGKGIGNLAKKGFNYVSDSITGAEKAKIAGAEQKFQLKQSTAQQAKQISKKTAIKTNIVKANQDSVNQGYEDLSNRLKKMITLESRNESINLQKDLPKLYSKKSQEYASAKDALIKDKNISVPAKDALQSVEDALEQHGILRKENGQLIVARAPMTPTEHEIFSLYTGTKRQLLDNPGAVVPVEDLMRTQKFTQPEFGRPWTPDDKLKSVVSQKLDEHIKNAVPGFKELQKQYAPFLEWKNAVNNKIQPFNSRYDTAASSSVISGAKSGKLNPDEQEIVGKLEENIGRQIGGRIPVLQKGLSSIIDKQAAAKEASISVIKQMRSDAANEIFKLRQNKNIQAHDIDQSVRKLVHQYMVRKIKLSIAGGAIALSGGVIGKNTLDYFFRREIYSGVHGH